MNMLGLVRKRVVQAAVAAGEAPSAQLSSRWSGSSPAYGASLLSRGNSASGCFPAQLQVQQVHSSCVDQHQSVPRRFSSMTSASVPRAAIQPVASKDESRELMAIFPDLVRDLTDAGRHSDVPEVTKWLSKVLQYNVPGGKRNRAMAVIYSYRMLAPASELTPENIRLSMILGWCIEILQAYLLVADDMMDESETRRGRPCWYKCNNLGLAAFNDALLLEGAVFQLIRRYCKDKPYYVDLIELFQDVNFKTLLGQSLDLQTSNNEKPDLKTFTMSRYSAIVKYKTAYYSFYLPVAIGMYMAGIRDQEVHRQARTILCEMGNFFQVQDDFLDCYGDPSVTGKIGTDIQEGKCTWLAVVALQRANSAQRKIMEECYGSDKHVARIKELYEELNVRGTYQTYEEESYNLIQTHIQQVSRGLPVELFFKFLDKIYKRQS